MSANIAVKLGQKAFHGKHTHPTKTAAFPVYLRRKTTDGLRKYILWLHGTEMKPLKTWDTGRFMWAAEYEFTAPSGPISSDQGDAPNLFQ